MKKSFWKDEMDDLRYGRIIICIVIGIFLIITLCSSCSTVESGEVGLKVRFGKIVGSELNEGLNFKIPFIEEVAKVNIKVQKAELTTESSSKDLQTITTMLAVNYKVNSENATELYRTVGNSYEETILIPAIQESIKAIISEYTAEQTITLRNEVSDKCLEEIQRKVEKYGITITDFNIIDLDFSEAYNQAIEEKQVAEQKVLTAQQNYERAKVENEQKLLDAETTRQANELLQQTITDDILMKQFIEKWDGHLPENYAGNDVLSIFNIR